VFDGARSLGAFAGESSSILGGALGRPIGSARAVIGSASIGITAPGVNSSSRVGAPLWRQPSGNIIDAITRPT
jgi:hypothetical protein